MSGVIVDLRSQLKASAESRVTMQSQSSAFKDLRSHIQTIADKLTEQAGAVGKLKTQMGTSAERHRQLACQVCTY